MKKTLVAFAALASVSAFAQSTVTITGVADAGYQTGSEFGQSAKAVTQNGSRTSALKFVGVEDLGGGLKAKFQIGTDPSITANNGNNFNSATTTGTNGTNVVANGTAQTRGQSSAQSGLVGAEQNYVGVEGPFGEVQFGTINTNTLNAFNNASQKFGTAIGSGYKKNIYGDYTRYENSWLYSTPTVNGLSARYQSAVGNSSQYALASSSVVLRRPTITEFGANYDQGPLSVKAAMITSKATMNETAATANIVTKIQTASVAYDFGVAKVSAGMQNITDNTATTPLNTKTSNMAVVVPVGAFNLMANTGTYNYNAGSLAATLGAGAKSTITGIGAHYNLSKNSYLYLMNESQSLGGYDMSTAVINGAAGSNTTSSRSRKLTATGISHAF